MLGPRELDEVRPEAGRKLYRWAFFVLLLALLAIPSVLLLAPTRFAIACPPPGIYLMCIGRTVHIWETAWWTGHTGYFDGGADWIGVGLLSVSVVLGAALIVVARKCAVGVPVHMKGQSLSFGKK